MSRRRSGSGLRIAFKVNLGSDLATLRSRVETVVESATVNAVRKAGNALAKAVRKRMPVDSGTARDAVVVVLEMADAASASATVEYDTAMIQSHSSNHFFYPAVIEYGTENRPAVGPFHAALAQDLAPIVAALKADLVAEICR